MYKLDDKYLITDLFSFCYSMSIQFWILFNSYVNFLKISQLDISYLHKKVFISLSDVALDSLGAVEAAVMFSGITAIRSSTVGTL